MNEFKPGLITKRNVKPKLRSYLRATLKGLNPIPYEIRNTTGDWTPYYGKWFHQRPTAKDLSICWNVAACEVIETQLQFLKATNQFSEADIKWFTEKGYIDGDGDFYLSRRFVAVISGVRDNGNDEAEAWRLAEKYGCIPNSMYPYTNDDDFFEKKFLTQEMYDLGKEFLKRVQLQDQELGSRFTRRENSALRSALFQAPLQCGVPVPVMVWLWNAEKIDWDGSKQAAHSIEIRKVDETGEYPTKIFDSYDPALKELSADYYIPIITRGIVTVRKQAMTNPVSQETLGAKIWRAIWAYYLTLTGVAERVGGRA